MEKDHLDIPSFANNGKVTGTLSNINQKTYKTKMGFAVQKNGHRKTKVNYISKLFLQRLKKNPKIKLSVTASVLALGTIGVVGSAIYENQPINKLKTELQIHEKRYTLDGYGLVDPEDPHDCELGGREEGTIGERVVKYANANDIPYQKLVELVDKEGSQIMDSSYIQVNPDGTFEYVVPEISEAKTK